MATLAKAVEKYMPEYRVYNPTGIVDEFAKAITKEIDFTYEVSNADRFRKSFSGDKSVVIPAINFDYSSKKIIMMDYIEGIKINTFIRTNHDREERMLVAKNIMKIYYAMVFEHG